MWGSGGGGESQKEERMKRKGKEIKKKNLGNHLSMGNPVMSNCVANCLLASASYFAMVITSSSPAYARPKLSYTGATLIIFFGFLVFGFWCWFV